MSAAASNRTTPAGGPPLSVVMPVHNALPHLDQAVESILGQTYRNFEFVILDDASTDGTTERLREWASADHRIRLLEVEKNLGPAVSSDRVARAATAPIVARMDADDISYPERFSEQLKVLREHPEVGLVASLCDMIDAAGHKHRYPEAWRLTRKSVFVPFAHGTIMYRQSVYERVGGYRKECEFWEDQDLITRMSAVTKIMVIPRALYQVRNSTTSTRVVSEQRRIERAVDLAYRSMARLEQNEGYDDLLHGRDGDPAKVDPRVFITLGSVILWSGGRPRMFRRMLRYAKLSFDFQSASSLVWAAWASASPASLRVFLRLLLAARNAFARVPGTAKDPVFWSPSHKREVAKPEPRGAV